MELKIIYEDDTLLVVEKPAGVAVFKEGEEQRTTIADLLLEQCPKQKELGEEFRYGILHRLDKDTSGILLVAKTKDAFSFFQKQFQNRAIEKKYICLAEGNIKEEKGVIETLVGRLKGDKRKQGVYMPGEPGSAGKREAITQYQVEQRYPGHTLLKVMPKTGRKHQIRTHLAYLGHPVVGDKLYGFKDQKAIPGLQRHFLHASFLKVPVPDGSTREFVSELPPDLKRVLQNLATSI